VRSNEGAHLKLLPHTLWALLYLVLTLVAVAAGAMLVIVGVVLVSPRLGITRIDGRMATVLALFAGGIPGQFLLDRLLRKLRYPLHRFRPQPGLCPACGYDLRATPARCPECGAVGTMPA
jgi:hypothetical protein